MTAITGLLFILMIVLLTANGEESDIKTTREYFEEAKSKGLVISEQDSIDQWEQALINRKIDSTKVVIEKLENDQPKTEVLSKVIEKTRGEVREKMSKVAIIDFPDRWSWTRHGYRVEAITMKGDIIANYRITYEVEYLHKGVARTTKVNASIYHNTTKDTWEIKRVEIPDFNRYWIDTPEGREEVRKSAEKIYESIVTNSEVDIKVSADKLFKDYDANEIKADDKYGDKTLEVSGTIKDIGRDRKGNPYILLSTSSRIFGIQCFLGKSHYKDAIEVSKGSRVRIKGRINGKYSHIQMAFCQVVK